MCFGPKRFQEISLKLLHRLELLSGSPRDRQKGRLCDKGSRYCIKLKYAIHFHFIIGRSLMQTIGEWKPSSWCHNRNNSALFLFLFFERWQKGFQSGMWTGHISAVCKYWGAATVGQHMDGAQCTHWRKKITKTKNKNWMFSTLSEVIPSLCVWKTSQREMNSWQWICSLALNSHGHYKIKINIK